MVLASKGLLQGEGATCYPAPGFRYDATRTTDFKNLMISHTYTRHSPNREKLTNPIDDEVAVTAGNVTTSKGPGTSLKFALELGEQLFGKEARDKIQSEMLV